MSKREHNLQKGLQVQQFITTSSSSSTSVSSKTAREVAKYRETCPPGTEDSKIVLLLEQTKGDAQKIALAISELWEDHRGNSAQDEWAVVNKKGKKKVEVSTSRSYHQTEPQDDQSERFASRGGRGSTRGRGVTSSTRGGRGGGRGRGGRGGAVAPGSTRVTTDNEEEATNEGEGSDSAAQDAPARKERGLRKDQTRAAPKSAPAVVTAPPPAPPILTGAWTKKLDLGVKTKLAEPQTAVPVETPSSPVKKVVASPKKKAEKPKKEQKKETVAPKSPVKAAAEAVTTTVVETVVVETTIEEEASPKATPKATPKSAPKTAPKVDSPKVTAAWGSLDVTTSTIGGEWAATKTEKSGANTPNAWARGSPILAPVTTTTEIPAVTVPTVVPGSPKDGPMIRSEPLSTPTTAASPKQYLKLGKWDSVSATNLSLQFGSFSLNGVEHDTSSTTSTGNGWASTTTSTTTTSGSKVVTKTTETQSAWGTAKALSPKKEAPQSPVRTQETESSLRRKAVNNTTSAPPGLSVEAGRVTPKKAVQSPRTFAPSAPSPASLPKPDEVKRSTPTRGQGHFQGQATTQTQAASKMAIGSGSTYGSEFGSKSSGLYQPAYNQYSMELGGRSAAGPAAGNIAQGPLSSSSNTPKSSGRGNSAAIASTGAQSPSRGQQQQFQMQQQTQQQPQQQQQKQQQTQVQQQAPSQQQQQTQQQQAVPQHHQQGAPQGYHPHYAPPPPPGMALPYNPYTYANYYQGYGYYQNPQYAQYSPRTQYPPRGNMPYGVEGPMPGFSNPGSMPVGYQDQHLMGHQHDYAGAVPQGFGEISGAYLQQPPVQQHQGHHHGGNQSHGKGGAAAPIAGAQQSHGQRSNAGIQGYQNTTAAGSRDHTSSPPVPNAGAGVAAGSYGGQHYGWASYGGQPMGGWGHMMPQGYQQNPTQHQQHPGSHQQSYRQYGNNNAQTGSAGNDGNSNGGSHAHSWSS